MSAGETVSVRVPPGTKEKIKAATGLDFSTAVRQILLAMIAFYEKERRAREAASAQLEARQNLEQLTREVLDGQQ